MGKFNAVALLIAGQVGQQSEVGVDHGNRRQQMAGDAEGGDGTKKAENQADAAEEFGADGQKCKRGRDVRVLGEETHGAGEAIAAKPAERLLRAMREEDYAKDETKDGDGRSAGSVDELGEH